MARRTNDNVIDDGEFIVIREEVLVNRYNGFKGTTEDYGEWEEEGDMPIILRLRIPKKLFEPLQITVQVPEAAVPEEVPGEVESIEIPITAEVQQTIESEELHVEGSRGVIGFLKRWFTHADQEGS